MPAFTALVTVFALGLLLLPGEGQFGLAVVFAPVYLMIFRDWIGGVESSAARPIAGTLAGLACCLSLFASVSLASGYLWGGLTVLVFATMIIVVAYMALRRGSMNSGDI